MEDLPKQSTLLPEHHFRENFKMMRQTLTDSKSCMNRGSFGGETETTKKRRRKKRKSVEKKEESVTLK